MRLILNFRDKNFIKKFFLIGGSIAVVYFVMAVAVTVVLVAREDNSTRPLSLTLDTETIINLPEPEFDISALEIIALAPQEVEDDSGFLRPPARTNFIFLGMDNNLLTDAIMVGTFYRDTGDIRLMSIPRDMQAVIPNHRLEKMRADGLRPPTTLRINAMRAFGGSTHGIYYLKQQLGEMLGVHFHYYVEVELDAFRYIVDAIGGVEVYVPRHFFYEDPDQNLFINISPGTHHMNGQMAEGFVRFRSFPMGDLTRNEMQMEFMSQLIRQVLTREAIMNNPVTLFNTVVNNVTTNVGLEALGYLPYIGNISADSISVHTMPGFLSGSWFMPDAARLVYVVNEVFYYLPSYDD